MHYNDGNTNGEGGHDYARRHQIIVKVNIRTGETIERKVYGTVGRLTDWN